MSHNLDELLRVVRALQTADRFDLEAPTDWRLGHRVIVACE